MHQVYDHDNAVQEEKGSGKLVEADNIQLLFKAALASNSNILFSF
jgi:hypothetical protein